MMRGLRLGLMTVFFLHLCWIDTALAAPHQWPDSSRALDQQMAATLVSLSEGDLQQARVLARQMARRFPRSALAQLLTAELESMAAHRDVLAAGSEPMTQPLMALLLEARARLQHTAVAVGDSPVTRLPEEIIQLGNDITALLVVDLADSTLHHLSVKEGRPTLIQRHYVGSGKAGFGKRTEGDNKTPLGLYDIVSYHTDASLPDLYGAGALTLNYPNTLDRHLGRTGSGIWLHGVPHNQRSRAPRSSEGCVTMSNDHFTTLQRRLWTVPPHHAHSPVAADDTRHERKPLVLLTHASRWSDAASRKEQWHDYRALFARYRDAWLRQDSDQLTTLYETPETALQRLAQLQQLNAWHGDIAVPLRALDFDDVSVFHNPSLLTGDARLDRLYLIMRAQLGEDNEQQLTLFWAQDATGNWQVVIEQWEIVNS